MRRYQIPALAINISKDQYPAIEAFLNSEEVKARRLDPAHIIPDKKRSSFEGSGLVVTTEGGAFLSDPEDNEFYIIKDTWKWSDI